MTKSGAESEPYLLSSLTIRYYQQIITGFLFLLHVALIAGLYLAVEMGRPRYFGLGSYIVIGVILFDILLIFTIIGKQREQPLTTAPVRMYLLDFRAITGALFTTIALLVLVGRGFLFYLSLSIVFFLILLRVFIGHEPTYRIYSNILLITGTSFTLIASQVFTVAYYVTTADTIKHSAIVAHVVKTGTLAELTTTRFWGFLVFHTLSAIGVKLADIGARALIALMTAIIFQAALIAIVLAVRQWTGSVKLALTAGVLIGFNASFLEWAGKAHYQSLSFVFFAITLLAFTIQFRDKRAAILSTIIPIAWVATHHLSFAMALFLTAFPVAFATLLYWFRGPLWSPSIQYVTFVVTFFTYWTLVTNQVGSPISWILVFSPAASVGLPSTQLFIQTHDSLPGLLQASLPIFISYVHHAFWLAMSMLGLLYFLRTRHVATYGKFVALSGFAIAAVFYFPNPLWIPLRGLATLGRWGIMTLPLLVLIPAYGIRGIFGRINDISLKSMAGFAVIFLLIFTTIGVGMTSPSLANMAGYDRQDQKYLTEQDIDTISFTRSYATPNQQIYGSSFTPAYAFLQNWEVDPDMKNRRYQRVQVTGPRGEVVYEPGLTMFQVSSYRERAIKVRMKVSSGIYDDPVIIRAPITDEEVEWDRMSTNLVYANGATVIQHRPGDNKDQ